MHLTQMKGFPGNRIFSVHRIPTRRIYLTTSCIVKGNQEILFKNKLTILLYLMETYQFDSTYYYIRSQCVQYRIPDWFKNPSELECIRIWYTQPSPSHWNTENDNRVAAPPSRIASIFGRIENKQSIFPIHFVAQ